MLLLPEMAAWRRAGLGAVPLAFYTKQAFEKWNIKISRKISTRFLYIAFETSAGQVARYKNSAAFLHYKMDIANYIANGSKGARTLDLPLVRRALIPAELCFRNILYHNDFILQQLI